MDRFAIISDIHGNLEALNSVLSHIDKENVELIFCCGDIVGYGANPNECVDIIIKERKIPTIAGNHDHAAIDRTNIQYFNEVARRAILWTQMHLTQENKQIIEHLPLTISNDSAFFVHSSPKNPEEWNYILTMGEARLNFEYFKEQFCFVGHSHQPFIIESDGKNLSCPSSLKIHILPNKRYLINVGSVGQPRDRNPRAVYSICDPQDNLLQIKRVDYDIELAQIKIIDAGIPKELADRLAIGW